jgi:hypothetical protein
MDHPSPELMDIGLDIDVATAGPTDGVEEMLAAWRERCPIFLVLLRPRTVELTSRVA